MRKSLLSTIIIALSLTSCSKEKAVKQAKVTNVSNLENPNNYKRMKYYNQSQKLYMIEYWTGESKDSIWSYDSNTGSFIQRSIISGYKSSYEKITNIYNLNGTKIIVEYWRDTNNKIIRIKQTNNDGSVAYDNYTNIVYEK